MFLPSLGGYENIFPGIFISRKMSPGDRSYCL